MSVTKEKFMCPRCKKKTLSYFNTSEGVVLDFCEECSGIWFDKDELASYIELSSDIPEIKEMKKASNVGPPYSFLTLYGPVVVRNRPGEVCRR